MNENTKKALTKMMLAMLEGAYVIDALDARSKVHALVLGGKPNELNIQLTPEGAFVPACIIQLDLDVVEQNLQAEGQGKMFV